MNSSFTYNLRLSGPHYDAEAGKHYNYFRDYDAAIGRYIESDPIGLHGGLSTYSYVTGRPLTHTDPEGLAGAAGALGGAGRAIGGLGTAARGGPGVAYSVGFGLGTLLYPGLEPYLSPMIDACFVEPECKLSWMKETPGGTLCVYDCTVLGMRAVWSKKGGCEPKIRPGEGSRYP